MACYTVAPFVGLSSAEMGYDPTVPTYNPKRKKGKPLRRLLPKGGFSYKDQDNPFEEKRIDDLVLEVMFKSCGRVSFMSPATVDELVAEIFIKAARRVHVIPSLGLAHLWAVLPSSISWCTDRKSLKVLLAPKHISRLATHMMKTRRRSTEALATSSTGIMQPAKTENLGKTASAVDEYFRQLRSHQLSHCIPDPADDSWDNLQTETERLTAEIPGSTFTLPFHPPPPSNITTPANAADATGSTDALHPNTLSSNTASNNTAFATTASGRVTSVSKRRAECDTEADGHSRNGLDEVPDGLSMLVLKDTKRQRVDLAQTNQASADDSQDDPDRIDYQFRATKVIYTLVDDISSKLSGLQLDAGDDSEDEVEIIIRDDDNASEEE